MDAQNSWWVNELLADEKKNVASSRMETWQ